MKITTDTEELLNLADKTIPWRALGFFAYSKIDGNVCRYSITDLEKNIRVYWLASILGMTAEECNYAIYDNSKLREFSKFELPPEIEYLQEFFDRVNEYQLSGSIMQTINMTLEIYNDAYQFYRNKSDSRVECSQENISTYATL